jgi:hypothetical protein
MSCATLYLRNEEMIQDARRGRLIFGNVPDSTVKKISGTRNKADWIIFSFLDYFEFVEDNLITRDSAARKRIRNIERGALVRYLVAHFVRLPGILE